jgi:hypothetical protein
MHRLSSLLLALPLLTLSCIERPEGAVSTPVEVNRASLSDVLLNNAPTPRHPVGARFDSGIELIGFDADPEPGIRGGRITVTFYFRATENVGQDWQLFVHVDDTSRAAGRILKDHFPAEGRFRTNAWKAGDIIKDVFTLPAPANATGLEVWTGFYQGNDRLALESPGRGTTDGQNRVRVGVIPLR